MTDLFLGSSSNFVLSRNGKTLSKAEAKFSIGLGKEAGLGEEAGV